MTRRGKLGAIRRRLTGILYLRGHGRCSRIAHYRHFLRSRPRTNSAAAAVVTNPIVVTRHRVVINVMNDGSIYVRHGAVVVQRTVIPVRAVIAAPGITETIVDAAIEADVRT